MNLNRLRILKEGSPSVGPVVYWMQRDQRVHDNWALLYAQEKAIERNVELYVVFNLVPAFIGATIRQYGFMLKGLQEVEMALARHNIHFFILTGEPANTIPQFTKDIDASLIVADFNPLRIVRIWKRDVEKRISIAFHEVDAHNIVPSLHVSDKLEFAARTIRPKIQRLLPDFLDEFSPLKKMKSTKTEKQFIDWSKIKKSLRIDYQVDEVEWLKPGETAAHNVLQKFIDNKYVAYSVDRNNPTIDGSSNLSPYFHFGHISPQRVALIIQPCTEHADSHKSFLEEMIVRRELSDNFCYFNKNYDSFDGFHRWAKDSLNLHRRDKREFIYSLEEFETAKTHDDLWNAAQSEMISKGKMHGYMRMYWAKKILEWSKSPEDAMSIAIYLNDKYELDGRDPNGYAGIAWSIGGIHDRAWFERPVYGKIRYMNSNGCAKKFDVKKYISQYSAIIK